MAVEMRDGKKILFTPISAEDLKDIHIGDIVYLTGDITTCRDVAHRRVVEEGREIPVDVRDAAILHAGPSSAHWEMRNMRWYLSDRPHP